MRVEPEYIKAKGHRAGRAAFLGTVCAMLLAGCAGPGARIYDESGQIQIENNAGQTDDVPQASVPDGISDTAGEQNNVPDGISDTAGEQNNVPDAQGQPDAGLGDIGIETAKQAALDHAGLSDGDVKFVEQKQELDDGVMVYEIEFVTDVTKYEYEIEASDGSVRKASQEPVEQSAPQGQLQPAVSTAQAKEAALKEMGVSEEQAVFTKVELENDDGRDQYEIEFVVDKTEYSVTLDASTGAVIEKEIER